jgi:ABC-type transporter Mla subunit MlaD
VEKSKKGLIIALIIVSVLFCVSTGIAIYYGTTTGPSDTQLSDKISEQRDTIVQLTDDLAAAKSAIQSADGRADELEQRLNGAIDIVDRSAERISVATVDAGTAIVRQLRINALVEQLIRDNQELKMGLGSRSR